MLVRDPREISDLLVEALINFCRRAERQASTGEARLALARLGEDQEREILRMASQEPPARPLSPHAFVDWISGMPAEQAAALEEAGAYAAIAREAASEAVELQVRRDREAAALARPKAAPRRRKKASAGDPTPLIRRRPKAAAPELSASAQLPAEEEAAPEAPPPRPGRRPAQPRFGRFVSGTPAKRPLQELREAAGAEVLRELIAETQGSMVDLLERINDTWAPSRGEVGPAHITKLLEHHGLEGVREAAERTQLRSLLRRNRGFDRAVARAWKISTGELRGLIERYGLEEEVKQLRARARDEALAETRLVKRLALLSRHGERLSSLGVERSLDRAALRDLRRLVDAFPLDEEEKPRRPEILLEMIRRQEGIDPPLWQWAVENFGLMGAAARRLGLRPARPPRP